MTLWLLIWLLAALCVAGLTVVERIYTRRGRRRRW